MINSVVLTGRLTKEPELIYSQNGTAIGNFTLAVNRPFVNQAGERDADFINCIAFKGTAETIANNLHKGSLIGVEGRLQSRTYDKDGVTHWVTEVIVSSMTFLEKKQEEPQTTGAGRGTRRGNRR